MTDPIELLLPGHPVASPPPPRPRGQPGDRNAFKLGCNAHVWVSTGKRHCVKRWRPGSFLAFQFAARSLVLY
jgi:hypothetical protein